MIPGLDLREYGGVVTCREEENYTVIFWIVVNDKTLKVVNYVNCKIGSHIVSDNACITVLYPIGSRERVCEEPCQESELIMTTTNKVTN